MDRLFQQPRLRILCVRKKTLARGLPQRLEAGRGPPLFSPMPLVPAERFPVSYTRKIHGLRRAGQGESLVKEMRKRQLLPSLPVALVAVSQARMSTRLDRSSR